MLKTLTNLIKDFWNRYEFEDKIFADFKATKEPNLLQIKPYIPLMPPLSIKRNRSL